MLLGRRFAEVALRAARLEGLLCGLQLCGKAPLSLDLEFVRDKRDKTCRPHMGVVTAHKLAQSLQDCSRLPRTCSNLPKLACSKLLPDTLEAPPGGLNEEETRSQDPAPFGGKGVEVGRSSRAERKVFLRRLQLLLKSPGSPRSGRVCVGHNY